MRPRVWNSHLCPNCDCWAAWRSTGYSRCHCKRTRIWCRCRWMPRSSCSEPRTWSNWSTSSSTRDSWTRRSDCWPMHAIACRSSISSWARRRRKTPSSIVAMGAGCRWSCCHLQREWPVDWRKVVMCCARVPVVIRGRSNSSRHWAAARLRRSTTRSIIYMIMWGAWRRSRRDWPASSPSANHPLCGPITRTAAVATIAVWSGLRFTSRPPPPATTTTAAWSRTSTAVAAVAIIPVATITTIITWLITTIMAIFRRTSSRCRRPLKRFRARSRRRSASVPLYQSFTSRMPTVLGAAAMATPRAPPTAPVTVTAIVTVTSTVTVTGSHSRSSSRRHPMGIRAMRWPMRPPQRSQLLITVPTDRTDHICTPIRMPVCIHIRILITARCWRPTIICRARRLSSRSRLCFTSGKQPFGST